MPEAWGDKRERQYEHIKESELEQGKPVERAKEIAARTVNKQRRQAGETPKRRTMGTGNPNTRLETRTHDELVNLATGAGIAGAKTKTKEELTEALRARRKAHN